MRIRWNNLVLDDDKGIFSVSGSIVRIGRDPSNDIVLKSPTVAEHAAVIEQTSSGWQLVVLRGNSAKVGEIKVRTGEKREISSASPINLFPYELTLESTGSGTQGSSLHSEFDEHASMLLRNVHKTLLEEDDAHLEETYQLLDSRKKKKFKPEHEDRLLELLAVLEVDIATIATRSNLKSARQLKLLNHLAGQSVYNALLSSLLQSSSQKGDSALVEQSIWSDLLTVHSGREHDLTELAEHILKDFRSNQSNDVSEFVDRLTAGYWTSWQRVCQQADVDFQEYLALRYIKQQIKDVLFGLGPLEELLRMPSISEIMVVSCEQIYVERRGVLELTGRRFFSDEVSESIISRIVGRVGRRIDRSHPLVDARLEDGSRVNAIIRPLAVSGPSLTIRKFPLSKMTIENLIEKGAVTRTVAEFLEAAVINRRNILVAGGTGTGKTTLLNCLGDFIPRKERIVTIEDTAELRLGKDHCVRLETKNANVEGVGAYTIRDLVKNSLRMRPDRIVVGECRGAEALDMLQAMNTGHDGSLTTIHANSSQDVILRLEVLVQMAADLPISSIHRQIASAIDLIVQLHRFSNGRRCVTQVTEVVGMKENGTGIQLRNLFLMEEGDDAIHPTGHLPSFMTDLIERNLINMDTFFEFETAIQEAAK
ncbi:ATPase, T2SS/T4P/T4SS family [Planctomicrobium sp. SH668]|uniref:ATPase, T2SS/T4P/T4SS family n=1 Tax=Planctomicrobium sp. SH668 TaxID=3448126 RepID=UPI003F5AE018